MGWSNKTRVHFHFGGVNRLGECSTGGGGGVKPLPDKTLTTRGGYRVNACQKHNAPRGLSAHPLTGGSEGSTFTAYLDSVHAKKGSLEGECSASLKA